MDATMVNPRPEKKTPGLIFGSLGGTSEGGSYFLGGSYLRGGGLIFGFQMTFDVFPLFLCASLLGRLGSTISSQFSTIFHNFFCLPARTACWPQPTRRSKAATMSPLGKDDTPA